MSLSRRGFVKAGVGAGAVTFLARRDAVADAWLEQMAAAGTPLPARPMLLHNNENPLGPGPKILDAVRGALGDGWEAGRYPKTSIGDLTKAIAASHGVAPENVLLGCGSTQILRTSVQTFTSRYRPLVGGIPSYEECTGYAELIGTPVKALPLDASLRLDLKAMGDAAMGAGMVFFNNPNNPTATVHPADAVTEFCERVTKASPDTTILVDEAYHDYVTDPSHKTQIPLAVKNPRVVVARTFSKAHGMAGLRMGYAIGHPDTIKAMGNFDGGGALNCLAIVGAMASIKDPARIEAERARNTEARKFTVDWFAKNGFGATDSQCNFLFVNVNRPVKEFREACKAEGVLVARDFPPYEKSHVRISIGTLDEMKRATEVFGRALGVKAKAA